VPADWKDELSRLLPGVRFDEPLSSHTTFRIGGPADALVEPRDRGELVGLHRFARERGLGVFALGWGSNLLVRDGGIRGIVLRLSGEFERIDFPGAGAVEAGAAARLPTLVMRCAERALSGLEPLVGVPGTFGGALVMNAGTREAEIGSFVREVEVLDLERLEPVRLPAAQLRFSYRSSSLAGRLVLGGRLELPPGDKDVIIGRVRENQSRRKRTQPIHTFNVGSTFKNPPGRFAAQLIEESGLKGRSVGGARVSPLHANFIENERGATAADVLALVEVVRGAVRERFGVELELEMKVVGEAAPGPAQA
jgi:UDP-N-acetylmuramate dehydrogenase